MKEKGWKGSNYYYPRPGQKTCTQLFSLGLERIAIWSSYVSWNGVEIYETRGAFSIRVETLGSSVYSIFGDLATRGVLNHDGSRILIELALTPIPPNVTGDGSPRKRSIRSKQFVGGRTDFLIGWSTADRRGGDSSTGDARAFRYRNCVSSFANCLGRNWSEWVDRIGAT